MYSATDPSNLSRQLLAANPNPSSILAVDPRIDFQAGANNTFSIRDGFYRGVASGNGVGNLNLQSQAINSTSYENALQISDTIVVMVPRRKVQATRDALGSRFATRIEAQEDVKILELSAWRM